MVALGTDWTLAGHTGEIPVGQVKQVTVGDLRLAVCNLDGSFFAIEDVCTHDGNPLADGPVEGLEVICPRHGARFCLRTGAALSPPAYEPVATFPVAITHGRLCIGLA